MYQVWLDGCRVSIMNLTPTQKKVVDICAERISNEGRGQQGLIIWQVCKTHSLDTKPIAQALQKRGTSVKKRKMGKELVEIKVTTILDDDEYQAVLFDVGRVDHQWIPRSVMEDWPDEDESGTVMVQRWFAEREEL